MGLCVLAAVLFRCGGQAHSPSLTPCHLRGTPCFAAPASLPVALPWHSPAGHAAPTTTPNAKLPSATAEPLLLVMAPPLDGATA